MIRERRAEMSDEMILRYCSPTLAGMKTGSLFNCPCSDRQKMMCAVKGLNQKLVPKGVRIIPLRTTEEKMLLYLYRPEKLKADLSECGALRLLRNYGYPVECIGKCVVQLGKRLCEQKDFPHEIGLFLGYPLEDVQGFIENHAEGYKCAGCWKVYGDEAYAKQEFLRYQICTDFYFSLWKQGETIENLTVSG